MPNQKGTTRARRHFWLFELFEEFKPCSTYINLCVCCLIRLKRL